MEITSKPIPGSPVLDSELIRETGKLLYGEAWEPELAGELKVSVRTIHRWLVKDTQMPRELSATLIRLLKAKRAALNLVLDGLDLVLDGLEAHHRMRLDFEGAQS